MSKIRMRRTAASPEGTFEEGKEYPLNKTTKKYIETGYAEYVEKPEDKKNNETPETDNKENGEEKKPDLEKRNAEQKDKKEESKKITIDDLDKEKGGHYYLDGEHFAHGEENAKEKLKELNEG